MWHHFLGYFDLLLKTRLWVFAKVIQFGNRWHLSENKDCYDKGTNYICEKLVERITKEPLNRPKHSQLKQTVF